MKVHRWQKLQAEYFAKMISLNAFHRDGFRMIMLTLVEDILMIRFVRTAMTTPVSITACTEYHIDQIVDSDEIKNILLHYKHYHIVMLTVVMRCSYYVFKAL